MEENKILEYLYNCKFSSLLETESITDISFNGESLFYMDNYKGRNKSDIEFSNDEAKDFIRHIANLADKQFSFQDPLLDVSIDKFRINATHQSICRYLDKEVITFSIRIASLENRIINDQDFMPIEIKELIEILLKNKQSIIISGETGVGKTELQKYIISLMEENERIIVIDNVLELGKSKYKTGIDLNIWEYSEKNHNSTISSLIRNGLRNNPDWLIIAESRGEEMKDILNSVLTGLPIITTIHAYDSFSSPNRIAHMVMMNEKKMEYVEVLKDICYHIHFYFHLNKEISNNKISRYIDSILYVDKDGKSSEIFSNNNGKVRYQNFICPNLKIVDKKYKNFIKVFKYE